MLPLDIVAILWFFLLWLAYVRYAKAKAESLDSLMGVLPLYRARWTERMLHREEGRIFDAALLGNLMRVTTFFASTTVLLLFATVAGLGAIPQIDAALSHVPLAMPAYAGVSMVKLLVLAVIFIYAFFKFTWALRQYGFVSVLFGAAQPAADEIDPDNIVAKSSALENLAATNFSNGLRAYYFALAALAWFVHPLAFMLATVVIVGVLYRREFKSDTLRILQS